MSLLKLCFSKIKLITIRRNSFLSFTINYIKANSQLVKNIFSLSFIQFLNFLIPLILYPYIIKIIGESLFGLVVFVNSIMLYFNMFVDFGFNYSGTKEMSIHRGSRRNENVIFSYIIQSKIILLFISFILLIIAINVIPDVNMHQRLYLFSFLFIVGQAMNPQWYFLGKEKMQLLAYFNLIGKICFIIGIIAFLKEKNQYELYALFYGLGFLISGLLSLIYIIFIKKVSLILIPIRKVLMYIKNDLNIFIGNLSSTLYIASNPVILGLVSNFESVAFYTIAEKIVRGVRYVVTPITNALYPRMSYKFSRQSISKSKKDLSKIILMVSPILVIIILMLIIFRYEISGFFITTENINLVVLSLTILSPIILIGTINNILGVIGLINLNESKAFRNFILLAGIFNVVLASVLSFYYGAVGAAISVLVVEFFLMIMTFNKIRKSV